MLMKGPCGGQEWPLHVSFREIRPQSVPWDRKHGCKQSQAQARAELIHPSPVPNGRSRALRSQLISRNSIKAYIYVEKMQPSLLEGNLTL